MDFMENLMIMQNFRECNKCSKFPWCSMLPDECEADPISEDELEELEGEINGTYSESLDW